LPHPHRLTTSNCTSSICLCMCLGMWKSRAHGYAKYLHSNHISRIKTCIHSKNCFSTCTPFLIHTHTHIQRPHTYTDRH